MQEAEGDNMHISGLTCRMRREINGDNKHDPSAIGSLHLDKGFLGYIAYD